MIGRTLLHYEVVGKVGAGGMGDVYLAVDHKLKRRVALKVLPSEMSGEPGRLARFQREAEAVAALNHPNIVTLYSVEEAEGIHFLTMELVEGKPLSEILTTTGLAPEKLLEIAIALTGALSAAHARGITHRDLKPQNVMIGGDGRVKVLDFGLAKFARSAGELGDVVDSGLATEARTQEGMVVGTVPYMSPEQAAGRQVDPRSDIFSLGIVLFEMATGRRPFTGQSAIELLSAILKDQPPSLAELKPELPTSLQRIIERCLAKDPDARYQDGQELHREMGGVSIGSVAAVPSIAKDGGLSSQAPWVAVLPFKSIAGDASLDSFAVGLTHDITTGLSRFSHLLVVSTSSASRYEGPVDVRETGKELGARFVVVGNIRQAGTNIRVSVELLDAQTGTALWAEHFDRDLSSSDIFAAQDELTDRIVATTADTYGVLTRSLAALVTSKPIETLTAYEGVLCWLSFSQTVREEEHAKVRMALEQVCEREPEYADAWACLSILYVGEFRFNYNPRPDPLDRALKAARRAVGLDATSQLGFLALAEAHWYRRELSAFRPAAERVLMLNPRDTFSMATIGMLMAYSGDWAAGVSVVRRVVLLNPHHAGWYHFTIVFDHYRKREYDKALEAAEKVNMPGYFGTHYTLAAVNAQLGRRESASEHLKNLLDLKPDFAEKARSELSKWFVSEELVDHVVEGIIKAGLDVPVDPVVEVEPARVEKHRPFVGRNLEQDKLAAHLTETSRGQGGIVLIGGEPGVGKTRLSEEVLSQALKRGMMGFTGHCYEEGAAPFIPFVEILEQMMRELPVSLLKAALGDGAPEVAKLVPALRRNLTDIPEPLELAPEQQRRALFNAVLELLERLAAERPVLLLLDDLHWADESTLALLQHLAPHSGALPLMVVGTYRDVELDVGKPFEKAMAALTRSKLVARVALRRLPEEAVGELLAALAAIDGAEPPEALVHVIFHETEGNAFFVSEVFQHLSEEGKLFDEEGQWRTNLQVAELEVPEGVRLVIGRRLERLSEATPKLLTIAAVMGRRFELKLLEALSGLDGDAFLDAIEEAERAKLIAPVESRRETSYTFTHEIIRHTLMGTLSLPRRQRLHWRVAEGIEQTYPKQLEARAPDLAHHLYQAGSASEAEKTMRYLLLAGDQALGAGASEQAVRACDAALGLLEEGASTKLEAEILLRRGTGHRGLGAWDKAASDWERALPAVEAAAETARVASICWALGYIHVWSNRVTQALALAERGLRAVGDEASADRCRLIAVAGFAHSMAGDYANAQTFSDRALEMAEALGDERLLGGEVLLLRAYLYHYHPMPTRLVEEGERAVRLVRRSGTPWDLSTTLGITLVGWAYTGRFDLVEQNLPEVDAVSVRTGDLSAQGSVLFTRFLAEQARGEIETSENTIARLIELCQAAQWPWISSCYSYLGSSQLWRGNVSAAQNSFAQAVALEPVGCFTGFDQAHQLRGAIYAGAEIDDTYIHKLEKLLPRPGADTTNGPWNVLLSMIDALAMMGRREETAELYPWTRKLMERGCVFFIDWGLVEKYAAIAASAGQRWEAAELHFENALRRVEDIPHRIEQGEVRRWYGRMLLDRDRSGDREKARRLLEEALAAYRKLGMPVHAQIVESLLKEAST